MENTSTSLNYNSWSLDYGLGIDQSIALLEKNYTKLVEFQNQYVKVLQKKVILGSYDASVDLISKNMNYTSGGMLQQLFDDLIGSMQDLNDLKLLTSTLIESDVALPLSNFISAYKSFTDYLKDSLIDALNHLNTKKKILKKLEEQTITMINKVNDSSFSKKPEIQPTVRKAHSKTMSNHMMESFTSNWNSLNSSFSQVHVSGPKVGGIGREKSKNDDGNESKEESGRQSPSPVDFPLVLGDPILTFESATDLATFTTSMFESIPKSLTKIPFTNYRIESVSVKDLTAWLIENIVPWRSNNFGASNPNKGEAAHRILSRSQIEKIGQSLLDYKFLTITNIAKRFSKFRSDDESLWFEYSDLFKFVKDYDESEVLMEKSSAKVTMKAVGEEQKRSDKNVGEPQLQTPAMPAYKRISSGSNPFRSLSSYIPGTDDTSKLLLLAENKDRQLQKFEVAYEEYLKSRLDLETKILRTNKEIERKEYQRISFMYDLIDKLSGILAKQLFKELETIEGFTKSFVSVNVANNYSADLEILLSSQSCRSTYAINPSYNSSYARLQVLNGGAAPLFGSDLESQSVAEGTKSVPFFIKEVLQLLPTDLSWNQTFDFLSANRLKNQYFMLSKLYPSQIQSINKYLSNLKDSESFQSRLLDVFKLYLLELPDSIIPSFVYEEIYQLGLSDDEVRRRTLLKLLENNLSRCSISAIILLFEHISNMPPEHQSTLNNSKVLGSIPFIHLILRQSYTVGAANDTFISTDLEFYDRLTNDLLAILDHLPRILSEKEEQHVKRQVAIKQNRLSAQTMAVDSAKINEPMAETDSTNIDSKKIIYPNHSRKASADVSNLREGRSSLKPFGLRERACSSSRSPIRRDINFRPISVASSSNDVDVLGNISVGKRACTIINPQDILDLLPQPEEDTIEINIINSSPKR